MSSVPPMSGTIYTAPPALESNATASLAPLLPNSSIEGVSFRRSLLQVRLADESVTPFVCFKNSTYYGGSRRPARSLGRPPELRLLHTARRHAQRVPDLRTRHAETNVANTLEGKHSESVLRSHT